MITWKQSKNFIYFKAPSEADHWEIPYADLFSQLNLPLSDNLLSFMKHCELDKTFLMRVSSSWGETYAFRVPGEQLKNPYTCSQIVGARTREDNAVLHLFKKEDFCPLINFHHRLVKYSEDWAGGSGFWLEF